MSGKVTYDSEPPAGTIDLGVGMPSADLLPVDLLRLASDSFFSGAHPFELNYGVLQGDERLLDSLAGYLTAGYGHSSSPESLFVTAGNSQALDLVSTVFSKPGDTVLVEEPSYYLAFKIFRDHGLNLVGVPIDVHGITVDALEEQVKTHKPAFVYTIPSFHNPGGQSLSTERRLRLIELSEQYGFLIVADEVYQLLHYYEQPPPAFGTMIESDTVLSLGTFSKILAPAMRLGWIQTGPGLRERLAANGFVASGGSVNHYTSHIVRHAIELGLQQKHVERLRRTYRGRVEALHDALQSHFAELATWRQPKGGYFFWLQFAEDIDTTELREKAREVQTGFQPGSRFTDDGRLKNFMRLCFAHYSEDDIRDGIARIRSLFD
jgi:DNA-binding transcriptional MocR family regulator